MQLYKNRNTSELKREGKKENNRPRTCSLQGRRTLVYAGVMQGFCWMLDGGEYTAINKKPERREGECTATVTALWHLGVSFLCLYF